MITLVQWEASGEIRQIGETGVHSPDDGCVYCLEARDGRLLWRHRVGPEDRRLPGNGRMISLWPVRCGVVVDGGTAYVCAGLHPAGPSVL